MNSRLSRQQFTALILALMATGIGQSLVFAILAPLGREVQLSELQITSVIAVSALVFAISAPYWGRFSDRVGRKPIIITGLLGYTAGTALFTSVLYAGLVGILAGVSFYLILLLSRCCQSIIMSATGPAASAYAADNSSTEFRTRTMARLGTANSMGTILGPAVSGALATLGLLAPLYFAAGLAALAALGIWRYLPPTPREDLTQRTLRARLRFTDPRVVQYLATAVGIFIGFSGIQQTMGFLLQDQLALTGIQTAQMTGAALMVSAVFTFVTQMTLMQRLHLRPLQFLRLGVLAMLLGASAIAMAGSFKLVAVGMALLGTGMGFAMPSVAAGASLAVNPDEQGAVAGLVSSCPAIGFVAGPICAGALYQIDGPLAPLFSAGVFLVVLVVLTVQDR